MITCSNCQFANDDTEQLCIACGQPLMATQLVSLVGAPKPAPVLTMIGAVPNAAVPPVVKVLALVPYDQNGHEITDPSLMIEVPQRGQETVLGWNYYPSDPKSKPNMVNYDLTRLYPWITRPGVMADGRPSIDIAVSKRSATIRTDEEGLSFFAVHEKMRTDVWANPYDTTMILIPAGFEIPVKPGMLIFMGKQQIGVTFIVREI